MGRKRGGDGGCGEGEGALMPSVPTGALDPVALGFPLPPGAPPAPVSAPPAPGAAPPGGPPAPPLLPPPLGANIGGPPGLPGGIPPGHMPGQMPPGVPPGMPPVPLPPQMLQGHLPPGAPGRPMMGTMPGMPPPPPLGMGGCGGCGLPLPGLGAPALPKLPLPGMPPPGSLDSESLAQMRFQQVATEYEQIKSAGIDPQVSELAEHHGLDERATRALDEEMKKRKNTFESDMQALWVGLEGSKNPSGMLMMKLKDMRMGVFKGMTAVTKKIHEFAKRNRLDAQAAVKLGEVMENRSDVDGDLMKLSKHLERSNKPSSLVMMMLRDLRDGKPVKDPEYAAAIGSKVHERELRDSAKARDRSRSRNRGGRDEARGGRHDRDRGDRDRRDRDRGDRDRDRDRRGDRDRGGDRERGAERGGGRQHE
ncbi:unnamed protein product [Durusdinium trenchii]|uniref:Uncharacterized protein n=1 Tax=Durusdinium trenchii TaxID=1381693 RepID=A0ABP0RDG8_9DINO